MELYHGAHLINCEIWGRPLKIALLKDDYGALLFDAGTRTHAERDIPAYLQQIKLAPEDLRWLVLSHPDLDHCGGSAVLARNYPNIRLMCGKQDRGLVENPEVLFRERYDHYRQNHGIFYDSETAQKIKDAFAGPQPVSTTLSGGEEIRLGPDRIIEVLHLPGHSAGHLGLFDLQHRTLYFADAIQGAGYCSIRGEWVMGPTYLHVDSYLNSIAQIRNLSAQRIVGCHWPEQDTADAIAHFCDETESFVHQTDAQVLNLVSSSQNGVTLSQLCKSVGDTIGRWPASAHNELCYPILGHLDRAAMNYKIIPDLSVRPVVYRASRKQV